MSTMSSLVLTAACQRDVDMLTLRHNFCGWLWIGPRLFLHRRSTNLWRLEHKFDANAPGDQGGLYPNACGGQLYDDTNSYLHCIAPAITQSTIEDYETDLTGTRKCREIPSADR